MLTQVLYTRFKLVGQSRIYTGERRTNGSRPSEWYRLRYDAVAPEAAAKVFLLLFLIAATDSYFPRQCSACEYKQLYGSLEAVVSEFTMASYIYVPQQNPATAANFQSYFDPMQSMTTGMTPMIAQAQLQQQNPVAYNPAGLQPIHQLLLNSATAMTAGRWAMTPSKESIHQPTLCVPLTLPPRVVVSLSIRLSVCLSTVYVYMFMWLWNS